MKLIAAAFYGRPELALPTLCLLLGILIASVTQSAYWGLTTTGTSLALWNYFSPRVVINDLRLGPIRLRCPAKAPCGGPQIWLTFDDGPGPQTLSIVEALNSKGFSATFFFIGEQVQAYDELEALRDALKAGGHRVANHSFSHPNFLRLRAKQMDEEMSKTQTLLAERFGELLLPLFRPPFGYRNAETLERAEHLGLEVVGWSLNSLDFLKDSPESLLERVDELLEPGCVVLFHDGRDSRSRTLSAMIPILGRLEHLGFGAYSPR